MEIDLVKIKKLRKGKKISLEEMAIYLGYKTATGYYYAESGRCKFKPTHIPMLAEKLEVAMNDLFLSDGFAKMANI